MQINQHHVFMLKSNIKKINIKFFFVCIKFNFKLIGRKQGQLISGSQGGLLFLIYLH